MFILARHGKSYAWLRFNNPAAQLLLSVEVDYSLPFAGSDFVAWEQEYQQFVQPEPELRLPGQHHFRDADQHWLAAWREFLDADEEVPYV